jgi:2-iminobutanoate/2-iminopropanoate deaminase
MRTEKPDRRKFLRRGVSGIAAAGVVGLPQSAKAQRMRPTKKVVLKPGQQLSPDAIFSPGIQFGRLLFVSGQGAHDPKTHKVEDVPFPQQARQCMENVKSVLEAAGSSLDQVLKCTVFLTDIANYKAFNDVYHTFFTTEPPARSCIGVKELPGDSPVEVECFAYVDRMG